MTHSSTGSATIPSATPVTTSPASSIRFAVGSCARLSVTSQMTIFSREKAVNKLVNWTQKVAFGAVAAALAFGAPAQAAPIVFEANLTALNGSGVSGLVRAILDGNALTVNVQAFGVEPDQPHPQHIHGRFSGGTTGDPIDSVTPPPEADTDGDGFIEVLEGAPFYGPIILPLSSPPATDAASQVFPTAPTGTINFGETYDVTNAAFFFDPINVLDFDGDDVLPLDLREYVLHGMTVPDGPGAGTGGEVNGTGGYLAVLPIAAGEFELVSVPEPATALLFTAGVLGIALYRRRRA